MSSHATHKRVSAGGHGSQIWLHRSKRLAQIGWHPFSKLIHSFLSKFRARRHCHFFTTTCVVIYNFLVAKIACARGLWCWLIVITSIQRFLTSFSFKLHLRPPDSIKLVIRAYKIIALSLLIKKVRRVCQAAKQTATSRGCLHITRRGCPWLPNTPSRFFHIIGYPPTLTSAFAATYWIHCKTHSRVRDIAWRRWSFWTTCATSTKSLPKRRGRAGYLTNIWTRGRHAATFATTLAPSGHCRGWRRHPATLTTALSLRGCHGRTCKSRCKGWCACGSNAACAHNCIVPNAAVHIGGRRRRKSTTFTAAFTTTCWH